MKKILMFGAAGLLAIGLATAATAHHAVNAQFDVDKEGTFTGTLAKLDNVQPHTYWYFYVPRAGGKVEKWSLEGPSPGNLLRAGLKMKEDIKPGKKFTVYYNVSRDGSTTGFIRGVDVNGKRVTLIADYATPTK